MLKVSAWTGETNTLYIEYDILQKLWEWSFNDFFFCKHKLFYFLV